VSELLLDPPEIFWRLAEAFLPGPLTLIVRKHPSVPDTITCGLPTLGIRLPAHPLALALLKAVGEVVVASSANISGERSSLTAAEIPVGIADVILRWRKDSTSASIQPFCHLKIQKTQASCVPAYLSRRIRRVIPELDDRVGVLGAKNRE